MTHPTRAIASASLVMLLGICLPGCGDDPEAPAIVPSASEPSSPTAPSPEITVTAPLDDNDTTWLAMRSDEQRAAAANWKVVHDFRFTDRREASGIDWTHEIVDDAGRDYKGVHYDHGTGVAAADVDGDGLLDLYFVNQLDANALWRNLGEGRFEDITHQAGVPLFDRVCVGASFADTDNDGDPDLYVTSVRDGNVLFENDGKGRFRAVADSGVGYKGHSSGAVFFDYDRDGLLDLLVLNIGTYTTEIRGNGRYWVGFKDAFSGHLKPERFEKSRLFRNLGGNRFEDVTERVGFLDERWSGDANPIDVNGDGWLDIYVLNMQGLDGYWESVEGKKFVDRTSEVFPRSSWGAMGIQVFDFENDGDIDIFITDMHSDMSEVVPATFADEKRKAHMQYAPSFLNDGGNGIYGNTFFLNEGGGRFREASDEIGAGNFWPWGLSAGDFNADGYTDAFIAASMNYPWRYGINSLLLNDAGKRFVDAEFELGIEPRADGETKVWFELDCAGQDQYHMDCPKEGDPGKVTVRGTLGSRSSVIFDLEGDGDLDIVTNEFDSPPMLLVSDLSERRPIHYLKVKLVGTRGSRDGLGARVTVRVGGQTFVQVHDGKSGYLGQSSMPLYFGLGEATSVDELSVKWLSGVEQKLSVAQIDQQIVVTEPN